MRWLFASLAAPRLTPSATSCSITASRRRMLRPFAGFSNTSVSSPRYFLRPIITQHSSRSWPPVLSIADYVEKFSQPSSPPTLIAPATGARDELRFPAHPHVFLCSPPSRRRCLGHHP